MQAFVRLLERIYKVHSIEREPPKRIHVVPREIDREGDKRLKRLPDQNMLARILDENW